MRRRVWKVLLVSYPRRWRKRYGTEMEDLVEDLDRNHDRSRQRLALSVLAGGLRERARAVGTFDVVKASLGLAAVAALVALLIVTVASYDRGDAGHQQPAATPRIERGLRVDLANLCAQLAAGQRATAIAMDPKDGTIRDKLTETCGGAT